MPQGTDYLFANESLSHGQSIASNNTIYQVIFQTDGNLVLYKNYPGAPSRALWATATNGHTADACVMQGDGNLVIYDPWRLASSKEEFGEEIHHSEAQAASVASVSAASGSFEDFTAGGVAADAKSSKSTRGASTPRAKI
jgi:hypothetical protein